MPSTDPTPSRSDLSELAEVPPDAWPGLVFKPHPTAIRLTFATNAAEIWTALKNETAPPKPARLPEPQALLVWREGFMARFKPLSTEEAMMWDEAAKGVRFSVLCEMVATFAGEDEAELRAASYLKGWVDMGMLAGFVAALPRPDRSQPLTRMQDAARERAHRSGRSANKREAPPIRARRYRRGASLPRPCRRAASDRRCPRVR